MNRKHILDKIIKHLDDKRYSILIGARQVGKTTIVKQVKDFLAAKKEKAILISFENPEILNAINQHPENIFNYAVHPNSLDAKERLYLLIDEVQYAENPSNFLKYLYDTYEKKVKVIATGSSAFYINKDFKDSLAGRKKIFELYTLDFEEFLHFKGQDKLISDLHELRKRPTFISLNKQLLTNLFEEYLTYGGYPAVVLQKNNEDKVELLQELVNSYMRKDVSESNLKDELKFFQLARILAAQTGDLVNQHNLGDHLKLSSGAIENYLYLLSKCFHIHLLPPKHGNVIKEIVKMPKIYFNDLGLRNTLLKQFGNLNDRMDKGHLIENYVYTRLRNLYQLDALYFWRTADGNEIDFVVDKTLDSGLAYEVKYSEQQYKASKYKKFTTAYQNYELSLITMNKEEDSDAIETIRL
ncbi:MAG: ATP-binding protein [Bacteroidota bacterium]|nr:ATP-binding protein [Bacteroidota bacterium]